MASTPNLKKATSVGKSAQETTKQRSPQSPNSPKQGKPQGSIGLGLLLIVIGTSLVGLGTLGYLFYQELISGSKREVDRSAELQTRQIESKLANIRQSADGVAIAAKALAQQPPKPKPIEAYQKLAAEGVQKSEAIAGIGIAQNENLLFVAPKPTVAYVLTEKSGLKLEASKKLPAPNDKLLFSNRADAQTIPQYKSPISITKEAWSEPYSALGNTIITYSVPITDGQKILGVVNADAIASNLVPISATNPSNADKIGFVIISSSGKVITASEQFQAVQSQNPATEAIKNLTQQSKAQPIGIIQSGGNLWAYRKLEGSDWLVATYLPESEITNKLLVLVGGAALGISTILAIAVLGFINSLKKRLQPLTEECDRFLSQQGAANPNLAGKDEIDRLSLSLKSTLQQVKTSEIRLRNELTQNPVVDDISAAQVKQETELMEAEVGDLLDVVSSMEEGDLTIEAQVNDRATGLVADTLNRLREKLVEIISSVLGTAQQVAQGASDLEELARTVVLNTAEQAQSVAQGQALTAQVAAIAQRSSEQVNVANQSLQEVRNTVESGQTAIYNLTESITVLQTGSAQIVQRMKTLGEFVGLAEQFVQDQGQIASLTQVLALNATLVAARAAEQKDPKQFSGVAREFESIAGQVNDLATQTNEGLTVLQQRTSQIQTVVTAIDAEVQNLSGLVAGFTTGVEDSQSAFNSIQLATAEVVQIGQAITESSSEIADAAGSTASYISEIAQLADRTADLTRSARQQAEAMGNQAQQLLQGIQFFRLPESSNLVTSNNANTINVNTSVTRSDTAEINAFADISAPSANNANNFVKSSPETNDLGIAVPAIAVAAAAATAVAISQSGQSSDTYTVPPNIPPEDSDNTALDGQYLENLIDASNSELAENYDYSESIDLEAPQEQNFASTSENLVSVDDAANSFLNVTNELTHDENQASELSYSELTDISVIEESLLADLRQEIYDESSFFDEDAPITDLEETLKSPMEGVNEFAIVEASSDPVIVSATSSFLEDTAFGTPAPLSEEAIAKLPTTVDFSIPDLDENNDFTIPKIDIESTLDNSNSFFDAALIEQNNSEGLETNLDPFAIDQTATASVDYLINNDDVFSSDYQDTSLAEESISDAFSENQVEDYGSYISEDLSGSLDNSSTNINENISDDFELENFDSILTDDSSNYVLDSFSEESLENPYEITSDSIVSEQVEDYNNYVSHEEFNTSLDDNLESSSHDSFNDTFNSSFDESPFDVAFGDALTDNDTDNFIENPLDYPSDNFDALSSQNDAASGLDSPEIPLNNLEIQNLEYPDQENQESFTNISTQIPDIYLDELSDDESTEEFSFEFQDGIELSDDANYLDAANNSILESYPVDESAIASGYEAQDLVNSINPETESEEFVFDLHKNLDIDSDDLSSGLGELSELDGSSNIFGDANSYQIAEEFIDPFTDPFTSEINNVNSLNDQGLEQQELVQQEINSFTPISDIGQDNLVVDSLEDYELPDLLSTDEQETDEQEIQTEEIAFELENVPFSFDTLEENDNIFDSSILINDHEKLSELIAPMATIDAFNLDDFDSLTSTQTETSQEINEFSDFIEDSNDDFSLSDLPDLSNDLDPQEAQQSGQNEVPEDFNLDAFGSSEEFGSLSQLLDTINPEVDHEESSLNYVDPMLSDEDSDVSLILNSIVEQDTSIENPSIIPSNNFDTQDSKIIDTLDFEESVIFEPSFSNSNYLDNNLDDLNSEINEHPLDITTSSLKEAQVAPTVTDSTISSDFTDNFSDAFSDNWLEEITSNDPDEIDGLTDLSIDSVSSDILPDSNYGFADNLLESLMEESEEEITDLSMDLQSLSINTESSSTNQFDEFISTNSLSEDLSTDSGSEFEFDFSAFDDLVSDVVNLDAQNLEPTLTSENEINGAINTDTSAISISARAEIEEFLSGTLSLEEIDHENPKSPENISLKADVKPNAPVAKDQELK